MKEATGELNMTVITVVAIAAVGAFFYAFVWPAIRGKIKGTVENTTSNPAQACYEKGGDWDSKSQMCN